MKKILLGILALVALAGCGGGGKDGKVAQAAPENINSIAVPPQPDATANAATVAGVDSDYISGVGKLQDRLLIMLDLDKLLSGDDMELLTTI